MIKWTAAFATNHPQIDEQHQVLFKMLATLEGELKEEELSRTNIHHILNEIMSYAQYHFATEENVMAAIGYPDLKRHALEHIRLSGKVAEVVMLAEQPDAREKLTEFVESWIINHIIENDLKYVPHLVLSNNGE